MNYFFDTEFIDDGKTIDLISIGIVCEDGRAYYAESVEANWNNACPWVKENVLTQMRGGEYSKFRNTIREEIVKFVEVGPSPTFWAWYGAYDWVVLCQLFGGMIDLPKGWPHFVMDVKSLAMIVGVTQIPEQTSVKHNALNDALWTKDIYDYIVNYAKTI